MHGIHPRSCLILKSSSGAGRRDAGVLSGGKLVPGRVTFFFFQCFTSCKSWNGKGRQSQGGCRPFVPYGQRMASVLQKRAPACLQMPGEWNGYGCGYNFKHDHYSMGIFTCKSHCCASLRNLCANLVPKEITWKIMEKLVEKQIW